MPEHVMSSFLVDQGAANSKAEEDSTSAGKGKVRRKQPLAKKAATNNPANLKRRGRKRKYPLPNPNEDSSETPQNVPGPAPPTVLFPENVVKTSVPVPLPNTVTHVSSENNLNNQPSPIESSTVNNNHYDSAGKMVSGLDVLAAVSFVLKQKDMKSLSGARDVPSNSGPRNENKSEQTGYSGGISVIQEIKKEPIKEIDQQQDYDLNDQVYDVIPGAEVRVEGQDPQQALLQMHNQPQYQKQTSDNFGGLTQQSAIASSTMPHIPQNPQEYVIVGPTEHEVVL